MTDHRTRRKVLAVLGVAGTSIITGCQTSGDSDNQSSTPTDTATPSPTDTPTPTPTETATPEPDLLEDLSPYQQRTKEIKDRFGDDRDQEVHDMFDEGNEIQALEKAMEEALEERPPAMPAYYKNREEYITSGAVKALSQALKLYDIDDDNAETTDQALGTHRLEFDVKRTLIEGVETDVAVARDTEKDETVVATKYRVPPEGEGDQDEAYQPGQRPQTYVGKALKGLLDSDDIGNGNYFDWETYQNAFIAAKNPDPEENARTMSRYFGDIVVGASLSPDDIANSDTQVSYPTLPTQKFQKQFSDGPSTGLLKGTREMTNKIARTDRAESETYILGKDYELIATVYDFSQGIPQSLDEIEL